MGIDSFTSLRGCAVAVSSARARCGPAVCERPRGPGAEFGSQLVLVMETLHGDARHLAVGQGTRSHPEPESLVG